MRHKYKYINIYLHPHIHT